MLAPDRAICAAHVSEQTQEDARRSEFLACLAHELRNPLAPIRTGIEILRLTGGDSQSQTVLTMMERQLRHLTRLLDDLLNVSRISCGKVALQMERIELQETLQDAIETSRPLIDQMGHKFTASLPSEPVILNADPVRLAQIVSNLLNNAAQFTPRGGRIELMARLDGNEVEIAVIDNGTGFPAESAAVIFDGFRQLENRPAQGHGGLGIGLWLVKGLVALHRGTVEARSEGPGRGSELRVRLPRGLMRPRKDALALSPDATGNGVQILLAEENRDAAFTFGCIAGSRGS